MRLKQRNLSSSGSDIWIKKNMRLDVDTIRNLQHWVQIEAVSDNIVSKTWLFQVLESCLSGN